MKSQAAMEYLMTYGWAILVIAVVLAALYSLGIFNPNTFAPKASAGSCEVVRPFGPGTTTDVHLEGTCTNMLPKYVGYFGPSTSDQILVNHKFFQNNSFTIIAWVYWPSGVNLPNPGTSNGDLGYAWSGAGGNSNGFNNGFGIFSRGDHWYLNFWGDDLECSDGPANNHWYQIGASWNNKTKVQEIWVNGVINCSRTSNNYLVTDEPLYIGSGAGTWDGGAYMDGYISNIQIYNKALSANQISALYQEGIGGAPIELTHLVGWWPLNGNAKDYSGNKYNGKPVDVSYSSTWYRTYSAP